MYQVYFLIWTKIMLKSIGGKIELALMEII